LCTLSFISRIVITACFHQSYLKACVGEQMSCHPATGTGANYDYIVFLLGHWRLFS
jgi:hypothetical protein